MSGPTPVGAPAASPGAALGSVPKKAWWSRATTIAAVIALVVIIALYAWVKAAPPAVAYPAAIAEENLDANAVMVAALAAGAIEDPFVDIDAERVYVAYNIPSALPPAGGTEGPPLDPDLMQRFVIAVAATVAPDVPGIVAVQYVNHLPTWVWKVATDDFAAYLAGDLTVAEFDDLIEMQHL